MTTPEPVTQSEIDQRVFELYDEHCHGHDLYKPTVPPSFTGTKSGSRRLAGSTHRLPTNGTSSAEYPLSMPVMTSCSPKIHAFDDTLERA
jgi:hypothetical protein